ncbi:hypothetical protein ACWN8V_02825 [Vagococcus elongatus]|uniref:Lipoprotein n=1 Tax=Vagococcus elongatus TaxID=180344 RepID=A0A430B1Z6_9ENTE|nr:hypothetical protein [Vagococcus elongatus]RSU14353.1 hypothetical protein CBF29_03370 [Vagococcus elongatus]
MKFIIIFLGVLLLGGCSKKEVEEVQTKNTSDAKTTVSTSKTASESTGKSSEQGATTFSTVSEEERQKKIYEEKITQYNNLSEEIKVYLAATTVDSRAESPNLMGFSIYYTFEGDKLYVQVHSGAGVGHPIYVLQYDNDYIYPVEGVVNVSIDETQVAEINPAPVSKVDLLEKYLNSKNSYDNGVANLENIPDIPNWFNNMKSRL